MPKLFGGKEANCSFNVTPKTYRTAHGGLGIILMYDARGWFYYGPASCGPKQVRRSGRGPYWRGEVSRQFAAVLLKKLREHHMLLEEN